MLQCCVAVRYLENAGLGHIKVGSLLSVHVGGRAGLSDPGGRLGVFALDTNTADREAVIREAGFVFINWVQGEYRRGSNG
jgi:hypothetical protein